MKATIERSSAIVRTPRLLQMEGIFECPPSERSMEQWEVELNLPDTWSIGAIVGPSGSGKTTVAKELFGDSLSGAWEWPEDKSVLDGFPDSMGIKDITGLLSSVGFSSPPSWVRPFHVLSNGEQFRVNMARTLAEMPELAMVDEFTSVVDRTVAQIGSHAIAKTVRRRGQRFIAVSCHYDILDWLEPDWVYEPATNTLSLNSGRSLWRRPAIELQVRRVHYSAWQLFRKHHYLDSSINRSARCWVAYWNERPVAFTCVLPFPGKSKLVRRREHRTVCLPDFQGVGIGNALAGYVGSIAKALNYDFVVSTSNPAVIAGRNRSPLWSMTKKPLLRRTGSNGGLVRWERQMVTRMVAGFRYTGPAMADLDLARRLWGLETTSNSTSVRVAGSAG